MVNDDSGATPRDEDEASADERATVREELGRLRELAAALTLADVKSGRWLGQLVALSLDQYVRDVDAGYFAAHYPGRSAEDIIALRIAQAARHASVEAALSAGAYTGAVAATIGTGGTASALTLPVAGVSFVLDLLFMSALQLRLAHDIAVLCRVPIDFSDSEDLWKLVRVAFTVKAEEAGRGVMGKGVPFLVPAVVRRVFQLSAPASAHALPVLGRQLLQRNVIKFAVPAVGVPLAVAVNAWSARMSGRFAARVFGREGRVADAARTMTTQTTHHSTLLWVLWLIIKSDGLVHENERLLLRHVSALVGDVDAELSAVAGLTSTVDVADQEVWARLATATEDLDALYGAGVVAAAVDGRVNVNELTNLKKLASCCGVPYDEAAVRRAAKAYYS